MVTIRPLVPTDWPSIYRIYEEGIATGMATMATRPPDWLAWDSAYLTKGRLVAEVDGTVAGWAALSPCSSLCDYDGAAELSIYVTELERGKRVGGRLLGALIEESESHGYWTLEAQILEGNDASIRLHESAGFRRVGVRERIGRVGNEWRNVVLLERRSTVVGVAEPPQGA